MNDIILVSMPWAPPQEPSLGLAILKSCLKNKDFNVKVFHTAPKLLKWLSIETYEFLADCWGIDEFLFTSILDPICDEKQINRLLERSYHYVKSKKYQKYNSIEEYCKLFLEIRHNIVPKFLDECLEEILKANPKIVGFTCMFDQTISSVALSKMLKDKMNNLTVVFGGYALEGSVSETIIKTFPWIDHIVQGDGEKAIVDIANNILYKKEAKLPKIIKASKISLNESPNPDYDDWFTNLEELNNKDKIEIRTETLPVESSRGCWWGQYMHCVFCGIDDETMKYRYKKPEQTLGMLRELRNKYGNVSFRFSDYIMPKAYYTDFMDTLAQETPKFKLQAEIKANHTKERIESFAKAGFFELQPGIESFSSSVLKSMDKGVRAIDNVKLLKYGYMYRIIIDYNFLYGLPDDKCEDYEKMIKLIPRIYHLTPPISRNEIVVTKFAPLQMNPDRFNIKYKPKFHKSYETLFSDSFIEKHDFCLDEYAYYFDRNFDYKENLETLYSMITIQIENWKEIHTTRFAELSYYFEGECYHFLDTRFTETFEFILTGLEAKIYKLCDENPIKIDKISNIIMEDCNLFTSDEEINTSITILADKRVIWEDSGLILGLGIQKSIVELHKQNEWNKSWMAIYV